ncbi:tetratricopeptide repeat protein [Nonomuraea turkmeniaca]|uniref:Tetratricopeptide repeat protein n=1 Tax=Nonomuraea turkmeniaca TaxID=103838 RepID=A0A5S4FVS2_9ACTN|nr:tetratricopeptide repeat protein [Nonomuraea turkmeniaca]TMR24887.1 tetratricopeptide repeat protein [Nonomuraea turkmeniaca]
MLRSLDVGGSAVPSDVDEAAARFRSLTATRELLLILDNALDARQVRPLIPAGPGCSGVVTSRQVLTQLDGVHHLGLTGLDATESTSLLARIVGPERVHGEAEAAERIVALCGGLLDLPTHTVAATAALTDWHEHRVEEALDSLQNVRLLEPAGPARYRMHDLVRIHAREQAGDLSGPERHAAAVRRVLHHYLATAKTASLLLDPAAALALSGYEADRPGIALGTAEEASDWTEQERDNLVAACQQAMAVQDDRQTAFGLAATVYWPLASKGLNHEVIELQTRALEIAVACGDHAAEAMGNHLLGWRYQALGRLPDATRHLEQALICWERANRPERMMSTYNGLGIAYAQMGRFDDALDAMEKGRTLAVASGRREFQAAFLGNTAMIYVKLGRLTEAISTAQAGVALRAGLGHPFREGTAAQTRMTVRWLGTFLGPWDPSTRCGCRRGRTWRGLVERVTADAADEQVADHPELPYGRGDGESVCDALCVGGEVSDERAEQVADAAADENPAERAGHPARAEHARAHGDEPQAEEHCSHAPQVAADQVQDLDDGRRVADRGERDLERCGEQRRAGENRDRVDEAEGGDTAGGKRVCGAEQAVEPCRCEGFGDDDEQFQGDPGAGERFVVDQVGERRAGVVGREEPRPDEQEAQCAGDGEAEVEQPGRAGGADQRVHGGSP